MDYREALDRITAGVKPEHIAHEAGLTESEIRRTRLDPSSEFYLPPPDNWRQVLARLAWERSCLLQTIAKELETGVERATL